MKSVAPSYSRRRDETSHTRPNAPLEPAQSDFACSALNETKNLEMDELRRLKAMYPTAPPRYTRRSGCGNGRNARNSGPSTSSRKISGIARRRSTSTTITTSSRRRRRCCRRRRIGNTRSRRSTSTTIITTSSTRGRRRSTSSRGEPKLSEGRNGNSQKAQTH